MAKTIPFTKEGLASLESELTTLVAKRKLAVTELTRAREMGDLSENGLYKAARFTLSDIDHRLRLVRRLLQSGKLIETKGGDMVEIGSTVILVREKEKMEYMIVGEFEANPTQKKISHLSPLGRALLGKKVGEQALVRTPGGESVYTVVAIRA